MTTDDKRKRAEDFLQMKLQIDMVLNQVRLAAMEAHDNQPQRPRRLDLDFRCYPRQC
jgi:hypothetical protein